MFSDKKLSKNYFSSIVFFTFFLLSFVSLNIARANGQETAKEFIKYLQEVVQNKKTSSLAEHCQYPVSVALNEKKTEIENKQEFVDNVDKIITPNIEQCILTHNLNEDVFVRGGDTYMIGDGCIWFYINNNEPSIFSINN